MKIKSAFWKILVLILVMVGSGYAERSNDPVFTAKDFYKKHEDFHYTDPNTFRNEVTPEFYKALKNEYQILKKGELGSIEAVPWTDAQDGEIHPPISFKSVSDSGDKAEVKMTYLFYLDKNRSWTQSVILKLERDSLTSKWMLSDLITPRFGSLRNLINGHHKTSRSHQVTPSEPLTPYVPE